jgi:hypothetical protein
MEQRYEVQSGRRTIGIRSAPSAQMALLDHVRAMGCRDAEIMRLGADSVAWRGAVFRAVPVPDTDSAARH